MIWEISMAGINYTGTSANEEVPGTEDNDTIRGVGGDDILYGFGGNDTLDGGGANDELYGGDGNDTLTGGGLRDMMIGGRGDDTYNIVFDDGDIVIDESGNDTVVFTFAGNVSSLRVVQSIDDPASLTITDGASMRVQIINGFSGGIENFRINGTTYSLQQLMGLVQSDPLTITGNASAENLIGGIADDRIEGLDGADVLYGLNGDDALIGGGGRDTEYGGAGHDWIAGNAGDDALYGELGDDTLKGGSGDDRIEGGGGIDRLEGGDGNDRYFFRQGDGATRMENGTTVYETINDASGLTTIEFAAGIARGNVTATLTDNGVLLQYGVGDFVLIESGSGNIGNVVFNNGDVVSFQELLVNRIVGTNDVDDLQGTAGNDVIHGLDGNDSISGGAGNDVLVGGSGAFDWDYLDGGDGNDVLDGGEGPDTLNGGAGDDVILAGGGSGDNSGPNAEYLRGGSGSDGYHYGLGDGIRIIQEEGTSTSFDFDYIQFEAGITPDDVAVIQWAREGSIRTDLALYSANSNVYIQLYVANFFATQDAAYKIEEIRFADGTVWSYDYIWSLIHNFTEERDTDIGFEWGETFHLLGGNDWLEAKGGDDVVYGGDGDDEIWGDGGHDRLYGGAGDDYLNGDEGYGVPWYQDGDDYLDGGLGTNDLEGGFGNDTYQVNIKGHWDDIFDDGGADVLSFSAGIDPSSISLYRWGNQLWIGSESGNIQVRISYFFNEDGTPSSDYGIEVLRFTGGVDWLGADLRNRIIDGHDDIMGGAGDDTHFVDTTDDVINEAADGGIDTVVTQFDYVLEVGDNIENVTLVGNFAAGAWGNELNNTLVGNDFNNILNGRDGSDTLIGGKGDDEYYIGTADFSQGTPNEVVIELAGEGTDTVYAYSDCTLMENVENLTMLHSGPAYIIPRRATGNSLDNVIEGRDLGFLTGAMHDVYDGREGNDTYIGYNGDYYVDSYGDRIISHGSWDQNIFTSINWTLAEGHDQLRLLIGSSALIGTGNSGDNVIEGNEHDNTLYGMGGNDTLNGLVGETWGQRSSGADTLVGGTGNDIYYVNNADGIDTIIEYATEGTDTIHATGDYSLASVANVENLVVFNSRGTGNALNNRIEGIYNESGNEILDGGAGADHMIGYWGHDTYYVDDALDIVDEGGTNDVRFTNDTVYSSINYTLTPNIENLILIGGAVIGTGNELGNRMDGSQTATVNQLIGGDGNDTYILGAGDTIVEQAGGGSDTLESVTTVTALQLNVENINLVGTGNIDATGTSIDNVIVGNRGNNRLTGGAGNDELIGGTGVDVLDGGLGNDVYRVLNPWWWQEDYPWWYTDGSAPPQRTTISSTDAAGNDRVFLDYSSTEFAYFRDGNDLVLQSIVWDSRTTVSNFFAPTNATRIAEIEFYDQVIINPSAIVFTQTIGTAGDDTFVGTGANDTYFGLAGQDNLSGGGGSDYLVGDAGNDTILGGDESDVLFAGDGDDSIDGGFGVDAMRGGLGNDTYYVDHFNDVVTELAGEGVDLVVASEDYYLTDHIENLTLVGAGRSGTGNALDNTIIGNSQENWLEGGDGNDYLDGGIDIDTMAGGNGDDIYIVNASRDSAYELEGGGIDTVRTTANYVLSDYVENLEITDGARSGTGNDLDNRITGSGQSNTLMGMGGNDTIDGGGSGDAMDGGEGNDLFIVGQSGDTVTEAAGQGTDGVFSVVTFTLGNNIENLNLTGTGNIDGTGNGLDNIIIANSGNNILSGGNGNDTYRFGLTNGNDRVFDTGGTDRIEFAAGISSADITVTRNDTSIFLAISGGRGTIALENFFLGAGSEIESIHFVGEDPWDREDLMSRLASNDPPRLEIPIADQAAQERSAFSFTLPAGTFVDPEGAQLTLTYTRADGTPAPSWLLFNTSTRTFSGTPPDTAAPANESGQLQIRVTATDPLGGAVSDVFILAVANHIQGNASANNLVGTAIRDVIEAGDGNDTLDGAGGDDRLVGGTGNDTMTGGAGNDTFVMNSNLDIVNESSGQGNDTVEANFDYTLIANFENLTLYGTGNFRATGNTVANVLIGNSGNNILDGLGAADTMIGGDGNDTYRVERTADVVNEVGTGGTDLVETTVTFTLDGTASNVENLTLKDGAAINGTGNGLNNTITGNAQVNTLTGLDGNDKLDGGAGADTMVGGAGNDRYTIDVGGTSGDQITEGLNAGFDWIESAMALDLNSGRYGTNVEGLIITSAVNMDAIGNGLDNLLRGNSQTNILTGNAGNDMLDGSGGTDTLNGNAGNGYLNGGAGADTLNGDTAAAGNDLFIGGVGNDTITTGGGVDIISFNQGDQADVVYSDNGRDNIVSLGRDINYSELYFVRSSSGHLILRTINGTDSTEQITFRDWFSTTNACQSVGTLQVVAEWMTGFNANGTDVLRNDRVETFDFLALANEFANSGTAIGTAWQITETRLRDARFIETGSDTAALGGDLAYQYGYSTNHSVASVGAIYAESLLDGAFGTQMQGLESNSSVLSNGPALL